jgi:uncharacterized protein YecE (DUF72 family)
MAQQLSLFGGPAAELGPSNAKDIGTADGSAGEVDAGAVLAAPVPMALEETARLLPAGIFLGTSSWSFPTWRGMVYGESYDQARLARSGLAAYSKHPLFRCVGIDRTFYAPIALGEYQRYAAQVPDRFRFLVKAPLRCVSPRSLGAPGNHEADNPHFLDPLWAERHFIHPAVNGLRDRVGPLVFQFPPLPRAITRSPAGFVQRLGAFFRALPKGPLYAVELRDEALLTDEYLQALAEADVRHCIGLHPRQPAAAEQARRFRQLPPGPLIVRWNLHPDYAYEEAREHYFPFTRLVDEDLPARVAVARLCLQAAAAAQPAFVVANNKAEGSAPLTIVKLAQLIVAETGAARET